MNVYPLGASVKVTASFTDAAGAAADPTTVTLTVDEPDGDSTTYTYGSGAVIQRTAAGAYYAVLSAGAVGIWTYRWNGTTAAASGNVTPVDDGIFRVREAYA